MEAEEGPAESIVVCNSARESGLWRIERGDEDAPESLRDSGAHLRSHRHASGRRRAARLQALLSLFLVAFLLLEAVPGQLSPLATAQAAPSTAQTASPASNVSSSSGGSTPPAIPPKDALPAVQLASLCLLNVLTDCNATRPSPVAAPAVTTPDPPSSWTNLTNLSAPTPQARESPAMVFSPADHGDVMFGGYGQQTVPPYSWMFFQDTWRLSGSTWSELVNPATCTASTCPSPRAGAMLASLGTQGLLLFGGYNYIPNLGGVAINNLGDTWIFSGGAWRNVTATAGTAPPERFFGSMAYDSLDNLVVLFGGETASGITLGDTWEYSAGSWANVTATAGSYTLSTAPEPRAGAAIAASPDGHIMMYGGEDQGLIISNYCGNGSYFGPGISAIAWWFYQGRWVRQANYGSTFCPPAILQSPSEGASDLASRGPSTTTVDPPSVGPPCGRMFAALGWSKNNNRFALYGGYGYNGTPVSSLYGVCNGSETLLNDTWLYAEPPGGGFDWLGVPDKAPVAREQMGYAGDLSSGFFVIFGGYQGFGYVAETWRFFELVHAKLSGPATIDTSGSLSFLLPFVVTGFGGSSNLTFAFALTKLRTPNALSGSPDCTILTSGSPYAVPYDGVDSFFCQATPQSYNIFRATVHVVDIENTSDSAFANWTFTVLPPESIQIYSQYVSYFYVGFDFTNTFTVYAEVLNGPATTLTATLGGLPLGFVQRTSDHRYWDATNTEMAHVSPGSVLSVTADFNDWTLNATKPIHMIDTPDWLQTIYAFPYGDKETTTKGSGPYNITYSVSDKYSWNIGETFNFSIPVPLVSGNYSLVPSISITFGWDSTGNVSLTGTFTLTPPKISLGVFSLKLSAALSLKGTFALVLNGGDIGGIKWLSAVATITIQGDFSGSIPIYGFSFDFLGANVSIGFTLELDVKPSVALNMLLAPTTDTTKELISGIGVMMKQLIGSFKLPLTAAVQFSIGIASVQFGGSLALALAFNITPSFEVTGGTVTGDIFVGASFLFWSAQWDLVGPGTIYSWGTGAKLAQSVSPTAYNNGSGAVWILNPRYYTGPGYDANVWNGSSSQGTAISDIYPNAAPVAAAASNGAYVFYTNDNAGVPVNEGLGVSGAWLSADTNKMQPIPPPPDSGYLTARPQATTLPDGDLYVVWDALPVSEAALSGPQYVTSVALHGARFDPVNGTWGAIQHYMVPGVAQSYSVDPTGDAGRVVALFSDGVALGETTPERLIQFDPVSGTEITYANVTGFSAVVSSRGASGWAVLRDLGGNLSVVRLADGTKVAVATTAPTGSALLSERFVAGSPSMLVLLYRGAETSEAVLYDLSIGTTAATLPLDGNTSDLEAIASGSTNYVFASTPAGIRGWRESGGSWTNLTTVAETAIESFGVVQDGSSILLYSLTRSGGNDSAPRKSLVFAVLGAALPRLPTPAAPASTAPASASGTYLLTLVAVAIADAALLAVVVIRRRQRGQSPPPPEKSGETTPPAEPPSSPPEGPSEGGGGG